MNHHPSIAQSQERNIALEIDPKCTPQKRHHRDIVGKLSPLHFTRLSNEPHNPCLPSCFSQRFSLPASSLRSRNSGKERVFTGSLALNCLSRPCLEANQPSTSSVVARSILPSTFYFSYALCRFSSRGERRQS